MLQLTFWLIGLWLWVASSLFFTALATLAFVRVAGRFAVAYETFPASRRLERIAQWVALPLLGYALAIVCNIGTSLLLAGSSYGILILSFGVFVVSTCGSLYAIYRPRTGQFDLAGSWEALREELRLVLEDDGSLSKVTRPRHEADEAVAKLENIESERRRRHPHSVALSNLTERFDARPEGTFSYRRGIVPTAGGSRQVSFMEAISICFCLRSCKVASLALAVSWVLAGSIIVNNGYSAPMLAVLLFVIQVLTTLALLALPLPLVVLLVRQESASQLAKAQAKCLVKQLKEPSRTKKTAARQIVLFGWNLSASRRESS